MIMNSKIPGLHHVTAIASDPQRNLDFYVALLGLRFVKRTVNFDCVRDLTGFDRLLAGAFETTPHDG